MRTLLRKWLYWLAPSIELGDRAFVDAATLRADVASLSLRLRVAEHSMAEWQRQARALTQVVALHSRDLAYVCAQDAHAQGGLAARVARLELHFVAPVYDGPVSDGRLDEALEAVALHGSGRDA